MVGDGAKLHRWCCIASYLCKDGRMQRDARADLLALLLAVPSPDLTGPAHILLGHRHGLGSWAETKPPPAFEQSINAKTTYLGDEMDKAPLTVDFHPIPTNLLPEPASCAHMCLRAFRSARLPRQVNDG